MDEFNWDSSEVQFDETDAIDETISAAVEAAYLHPDTDLDAYLSPDEYEREEDVPIPEKKRVNTRSGRKEGGFLGILKGRHASAEHRNSSRVTSEEDLYPYDGLAADGDPTDAEENISDSVFAAASPGGSADPHTAFHGGNIGKTEEEARELIASMQAESGAARRDKRMASDYRLDLDDLLGISGEESPDVVSAVQPDGDDYYEPALELDPDDLAPDIPSSVSGNAAAYSTSARDPEIDSRFNLSGINSRKTVSYGAHDVDLSPDADYVPAQQSSYSPSQWSAEYDDPLVERPEVAEPGRKTHRSLFGKKRRAEHDEAPSSPADETEEQKAPDSYARKAAPPIYMAEDDPSYAPAYSAVSDESSLPDNMDDDLDFDEADYEEFDDERSRKYRESELYVPPSFHEYLLSILASVWLRLRGTVRGRTAETMSDTEEDLGDELSPTEASRYYGSFLRSMKLRLHISAAVLAVLAYVSLEMPIPGQMQSLPTAAAFCFGMQAVILLLALDLVTNGITNAFRMHFGADSLAVVSCLFTGLDAMIVALSDTAALHMPLCAVSSASVVGLLLSSYLSARGLRKATRVPAIGKKFFAVTGETKLEPGEITLLKSKKSAAGFVRRTEEAGPDETLYARLAPILFLAAFVMALIVMLVKKSYPELIYIFSAMLVLTVPFGAMLSFSLPFFLGSTRIFKFGAAIAGWSGLCDIGVSKNLILTDRDLFPESAVSIESVRIFADEDAQKVISYAGSMISASGGCSAGCFEELMRETDSPPRSIGGFEVLPGGGMKGIIDGHLVLCGSTDLMRLMNVRIPFRLTDKTTVLLAIDGILYGIFSLTYEGQPQIRKALSDLVRSARPPVFAVRDFNVNPEMLHNTYDLATDGYDFPPFVERYRLSEPSEDNAGDRIAAILCNEGLPPLTSVAAIGRSMYTAVRVNVILNLIAALLGMLLVFIRFLASGTNSLASLFLYMVFWTLPVLITSFSVNIKR